MQKTLSILGLFAVLIVGLISPAMAEGDDKWDEQYRELEREFDEKRQQIEREANEQFEELDREHEKEKNEIYEKIESNPDIKDSEIDRMFDELFSRYDEKRQSIESEIMKQFEEMEREFENELQRIDDEAREYDEEQEKQYDDDYDRYEEYDAAGNKYDDYNKYEEHDDDYDRYEGYDDDYKDYQPHEDDPEWKSIEPLTQRIMDVIPMEKVQHFWESGQVDELLELIVSETDLSYEEAKRVIAFHEKYKDRHDEKSDEYERDYPDHRYDEPYPYLEPTNDDSQILKLEQRISELVEENRSLQNTISELEKKVSQMNTVLMEQIKFIYEWATSQ